MSSATNGVRAFHRSNKAWYSSVVSRQQVMFGIYHREGGCTAEMAMVWINLGSRLVPNLRVFDDAWKALASFTDVIAALAERDSDNISEVEFCEILKTCGFEDFTEYEENKKP